MFCTNCGTKNEDSARFCSNCGKSLGQAQSNGANHNQDREQSQYNSSNNQQYGNQTSSNQDAYFQTSSNTNQKDQQSYNYQNPNTDSNQQYSYQSQTNGISNNPFEYFTLAFKNFAVFEGRAHRAEYWYFVLFNFIVSFGIGFVSGLFFEDTLLADIYTLAVIIPGLTLAVRRLHDTNNSGWMILIPIYNLILMCTESTPGPNRYGEPSRN